MFRNSNAYSDKTDAVPDTVEEEAHGNMRAKGRKPERHDTAKNKEWQVVPDGIAFQHSKLGASGGSSGSGQWVKGQVWQV